MISDPDFMNIRNEEPMLKFHNLLILPNCIEKSTYMTESPAPPTEPIIDSTASFQFDQARPLVAAEFEVEEALIEYDVPTFYLHMRPDSKEAFTRLIESLSRIGLTPLLREVNGKYVLKAIPKKKAKPGRPLTNVALLLITIATVFTTGYFLSVDLFDPWVGAASFTLALLGILGVHEMAHKLAANRHKMEASMPYFIPGPPFFGLGTFGAVIVQKDNASNRDALFDIGVSGPIAGFIVALFVSAIGLALSPVEPVTGMPSGVLPTSLLFSLLVDFFVKTPGPGSYIVLLHPVAFAGWVGLFVTLLNLLPTGMLDGGHTLRSIINKDSTRTIFTLVSIGILIFTGQLLMLAFVIFLSMFKHPGPLDDVSKLSSSRKLISVLLIAIFVLCLFLPLEVIAEIYRFFGFFF